MSREALVSPTYMPTDREQRAIDSVASRKRERKPRPSLKVTSKKADIDHADPATGWLLMTDSLGVDDSRIVSVLIGQLANLTQKDGKIDQLALNARIALVQGIAPTDPIEAMIAAQMAAVHCATMVMARRLNGVDNLHQQDSASNSFNKLARTFAVQMDALKRYRTGGQQSVVVKHVTVNEGGQAIVGAVTTGGVGAR